MRVLVFGGSGLVGRAAARKLPGEWRGFFPVHKEFDICDPDAPARALRAFQPDAVLNCAAFTDVDGCERQPERAFAVNHHAVARLSAACKNAGVPLFHIGTDYVFSGNATAPICEESPTGPVNAYGASKLAGELAVLQDGGCVLRVQWLYGLGKSGFVDRVLQSSADSEIKVVGDCFGIPTFADDVANMLFTLIASESRGLFHGACTGQASWLEFAQEIAAQTGLSPKLRPIPASALNRPAKRPQYTVLHTEKLAKLCPLRPWQQALAEFLALSAAR